MANSLNFNMDLGNISSLAKTMGIQGLGADEVIIVALTKSAIEIQAIARLEAPSKTGRLRNSIGFKVKGFTATISPNTKYAGYVEMGTGIYGPNKTEIVPKNKKVLASKINPGFGSKSKKGYYIIGRKSKGQKANPYMERSATLGLPIILKNFKGAAATISKKFTASQK